MLQRFNKWLWGSHSIDHVPEEAPSQTVPHIHQWIKMREIYKMVRGSTERTPRKLDGALLRCAGCEEQQQLWEKE